MYSRLSEGNLINSLKSLYRTSVGDILSPQIFKEQTKMTTLPSFVVRLSGISVRNGSFLVAGYCTDPLKDDLRGETNS